MNLPPYVLVTPVRDEASFVGETILSVLSQTHLPRQWIIVSDGSTDGTDEIVRAAESRHKWIRLVTLPQRPERSFTAVVRATELGVRALTVLDYRYIGLLDADVRFAPHYFEKVIERLELSSQLGLAGGHVVDFGLPEDRLPHNRLDVPGAAQFFRRECFEALGGLLAIPEGGWDALTCARARMLGYETRLFSDLIVQHLKPRNTAEGGALRRAWQMGIRDHALGYHPLFELVKTASRIGDPPPLIGSMAWLAGYGVAWIARRNRIIPRDLFQFVRSEQFARLKRQFGLLGTTPDSLAAETATIARTPRVRANGNLHQNPRRSGAIDMSNRQVQKLEHADHQAMNELRSKVPAYPLPLSVLIVNWNSKDFLRKCLETLMADSTGLSLQTVVVDAGSHDGCGQMLAKEFPQVVFV